MSRKKIAGLGILCAAVMLAGCGREEAEAPEEIQAQQPENETEASQEAPAEAQEEETEAEEAAENPVTLNFSTEKEDFQNDAGVMVMQSAYTDVTVEIEGNEPAAAEIMAVLASEKENFKEARADTVEWALSGEDAYITENGGSYYVGRDYEEERNDGRVLSLRVSDEGYTGGAHGYHTQRGLNFDTKTGKKLTIGDIAANKEQFTDICVEEMLTQARRLQAEGLLFEDEMLDPPGLEQILKNKMDGEEWYFTKGGIRFISNTYEIAPYVAGEITFDIPYELLGDALKEEYRYQGQMVRAVKNGAETSGVDLNQDGQEDSVCVGWETDEDTWEAAYSVIVNGEDLTEQFNGFGLYFSGYGYLTDDYYLVDLDMQDAYVEIAVQDRGDNDWHSTYFFRYETGGDGKGKLDYLGDIPLFLEDNEVKMDGQGSIEASFPSVILETCRAEGTYVIGEDGRLALAEQEMYPFVPFTIGEETEHAHQVLSDTCAYVKPDLNSERLEIRAGSGPYIFTATDNEHWVEMESADGSKCYLYIEEFSIIRYGDTQQNATDVFDNIHQAG